MRVRLLFVQWMCNLIYFLFFSVFLVSLLYRVVCLLCASVFDQKIGFLSFLCLVVVGERLHSQEMDIMLFVFSCIHSHFHFFALASSVEELRTTKAYTNRESPCFRVCQTQQKSRAFSSTLCVHVCDWDLMMMVRGAKTSNLQWICTKISFTTGDNTFEFWALHSNLEP